MEVLSLSQTETKALLELEAFSADQVAKICRTFVQRLLLGSGNDGLDDKVAQSVDAVGSLFLSCAKIGASAEQLQALLQEHALSAALSEALVSCYAQYAQAVTAHLQRVGVSFPQVVGVDWRLDYMVRSKSAGRENVPMFHVALKLMDTYTHTHTGTQTSTHSGTGLREVSFIASLEEMQDLLAKVRDAAKQVERVLATNAEE